MTALERKTGLRPLDLYVGVMAAAGAAIAAWSVIHLPHVNAFEWMLFSVLALIAGRFPLRIPGITATFAVTDTFFVTSALLFGPAPATVTMAIDSLAMSVGRGYPVQRFLFNGSAPAISFWVGCQVFFALLGSGPVYATPVAADPMPATRRNRRPRWADQRSRVRSVRCLSQRQRKSSLSPPR